MPFLYSQEDPATQTEKRSQQGEDDLRGIVVSPQITISSIKVNLAEKDSPIVRAYVSFVLCDFLMVRDVRVVDLGNGPILAMPSRRREEVCPTPGCLSKVIWRQPICHKCRTPLDKFWDKVYEVAQVHYDVVHPISREARALMTREVIRAYEDTLKGGMADAGQPQVVQG